MGLGLRGAKHWYLHLGLRGRSTIKMVLPTLAPKLSYDDLEIAEGQSAALIFGPERGDSALSVLIIRPTVEI